MQLKTALVLLAAACFASAGRSAEASTTPKIDPPRVGVYDSRAVAYAHFWGDAAAAKRRNDLMAAARAAQQAGDQEKFGPLHAQVVALQKRNHLQVFSTAPVDEAMAALKDRLPVLYQELGVERLVSKWDEAALKAVPEARRVDVTDRLVREFLPTPSERQLKVMASMKSQPPLPLAEATKLADEGKM